MGLLTINQFESVVIDPGVCEKFGRQVWGEYIYEVQILGEDFCRNFLGNQNRYLRSTERINIELELEEAGRYIGTD